MREISRAVVFKDSKLLVIRRNKYGKVYTVLPGGKIEQSESPEDACVREVFEETSVKIKIKNRLFESVDQFGKTIYFLAEYLSGEPKLSPGSPEHQTNLKGLDTYTPLFLPVESINEEPFFNDSKNVIELSGIIKRTQRRNDGGK